MPESHRRERQVQFVRLVGIVALQLWLLTALADGFAIAEFSALEPGSGTPDGWELTTLPNVSPPEFEIIEHANSPVLRISSAAAAGSLTRDGGWDPGRFPLLQWRWRVDRVVEAADLRRRDGDDYAARLYVFFDVPLQALPFVDRTKIRLARWLYGERLPAAALCYVWDNDNPIDTTVPNAYTDRVQMIVLRNRDDAIGEWVDERRNIADDFAAAFDMAPVPISGIALSADTDQSGESVTAWFGDIQARAAP